MSARRRRPPSDEERARLGAHRGLATWGESLVPLERFRRAASSRGRSLEPAERRTARERFVSAETPAEPVEGPYSRVVVCGGAYSNHLALAALLEEAAAWGAEAIYCLGDLGGFGPSPERVKPLLEAGGVRVLMGNYEESLASGREDCNCGYTDPRDNHFAELSYRYTAANCSADFKAWMGDLPQRRRLRMGEHELLLVHGSPRRINEFLFDSTSPDDFLELLLDRYRCDALLFTHTGLHWHRRLPSGREVANVGVLGRPANDGRTAVWYARLELRDDGARPDARPGGGRAPGARRRSRRAFDVELVPLVYDHRGLAVEMRRERLPEEFVETILTGWWTTCLEILPAKERAASRF